MEAKIQDFCLKKKERKQKFQGGPNLLILNLYFYMSGMEHVGRVECQTGGVLGTDRVA